MATDRGRLAVLASHGGTTLQAIIDACEANKLEADVVLVISNNSSSGALARAQQHRIEHRHISARSHAGAHSEDAAIAAALQASNPDWVVLAGYMKRLGPETLAAFPDRVINTHPALLPKHGGEGCYGDHVHAAVLAAGERESGATVHRVNADYDRGAVLAQVRVSVAAEDSIASLRERVQSAEKALLIDTLAQLLSHNQH